MGSVHVYETKAGKKLWRAVWRDPLNQQTSKRGFTTKRAAEEHIARQTVSKADGTYIPAAAAKVTVGELSEAWLADKAALLKPSSYAPLRSSWTNYVEPTWGPRAISSIRHSEVQTWVASIGKSPTVVARAYGILAGILDVAERDRRILANPARGVRLPRKVTSRARRYLTHDQLWSVAGHSGRPALVLTLGYCGLRWGELVALRVSDVNFLRRRISVTRNVVEVHGQFHPGTPKTHEARQVPVPAAVLKQLEKAVQGKAPDALIFDDGHGGYMRRTRASTGSRSWWLSALTAAGVEPLVLHDLRHTAASLAVSSGANVKAIQRMLGHASAAMTLDVYADLFDDDLEALATRLDEAIGPRVVVTALPREA
jgi:integrase